MSATITRDDWLRAMKDASGYTPNADDPSAMTISELAAQEDIAWTTARTHMYALVKRGKAVKVTKPLRYADGRVVSVSAYRLLPEGSHASQPRSGTPQRKPRRDQRTRTRG